MDINPDRKRDWGRRVDVFWEGDGVYYRGTVTGYSTTSGKHTIMYDDGDVERVKLSDVSAIKALVPMAAERWLSTVCAANPLLACLCTMNVAYSQAATTCRLVLARQLIWLVCCV